MEGSLQAIMGTVLQKLPKHMQKQARLMLLPYSKPQGNVAADAGTQ